MNIVTVCLRLLISPGQFGTHEMFTCTASLYFVLIGHVSEETKSYPCDMVVKPVSWFNPDTGQSFFSTILLALS